MISLSAMKRAPATGRGEIDTNRKDVVSAAFALSLFLLSLAFKTPPARGSSIQTITFVSDLNDLCWKGANSSHVSGGYISPPGSAIWSNAVIANWGIVPGAWNPQLTPAGYKNTLFAAPSANWIWTVNPLPNGETYTGDIVFFRKSFTIPAGASVLSAYLYITVDNGYYVYVNNLGWSGTGGLFRSPGNDGFEPGYDPTNFYYVADGSDKSGGTNSAPYEQLGRLYPLEASVERDLPPPSTTGYWQSIERYDISNRIVSGVNWLQVVAINEHAPPTLTGNPAGLIYKAVIVYEVFEADLQITKTGPKEGIVGETITYTITVKNNGPDTGRNVVVTDSLLGQIYGPKDLAPGATETITIKYTLRATDRRPLRNTAQVNGSTPDPNPGNNQASWLVNLKGESVGGVIVSSYSIPLFACLSTAASLLLLAVRRRICGSCTR